MTYVVLVVFLVSSSSSRPRRS